MMMKKRRGKNPATSSIHCLSMHVPTDCECHCAAGRQFLLGKTLGKRIGVSCQGHIGIDSATTRGERQGEEERQQGHDNDDNDNNINSSSAAPLKDHRNVPYVSFDKQTPEQAFQSRSELWQRQMRLLLKYSAVASAAVLVAGLTMATPLAANASSVGQSVSWWMSPPI